MNRVEHYRGGAMMGTGTKTAKDIETWLGNSLAFVLVSLAVASGVIGLLVNFQYIDDGSTRAFENGMIWLVSGLILGICANAFRREHHVVDPEEFARFEESHSGGGRSEEARRR